MKRGRRTSAGLLKDVRGYTREHLEFRLARHLAKHFRMEAVDTLISARWVIPIEPAACVLERHAVAVRQGRIIAVLPKAEAEKRYSATEKVERPEHVLLPGFINAHAAAALALPLPARSARQPGGSDQTGSTSPGFEPASSPADRADPEFIRDGTELSMARMIRSGTTCFADFSVYPDLVARTAALLHIRACVALPIRAQASAWASDADEYFDRAAALHDVYRADPLISTAFATPPVTDLGDEILLRLRPKVDELEMPVAIPLHASTIEIDLAQRRFGCRPLERLERLDLVTPQLVALHLTQVSDSDRALLARSGAQAVAAPRADSLARHGRCPVERLRREEVNVALGTGNLVADLRDEMRLVALTGSQAEAPVAAPLASHEILHLATLGGARALGLSEATGSLLPGKWADLCCIDLTSHRTQPVMDVPLQTLHFAGSDQVTDVWVAGRGVLVSGHLVGLDLAGTLSRISRWYS